MHHAELYGRVLKVELAKPMRLRDGSTRAIWAEEGWLEGQTKDEQTPASTEKEKPQVQMAETAAVVSATQQLRQRKQ